MSGAGVTPALSSVSSCNQRLQSNKCKSTNDVNAMQAQRDQKCPGHSAKEVNKVNTLFIETFAQ